MAPGTILVVDPQAPTCHVIAATLQDAAFDVLQANRVETAVRLAARHHLDLVIIDLHLPDHGAADVVRQITARSPTTPILALDTVGGGETPSTGGSYAAILVKPFEIDELVALVHHWCPPLPAPNGAAPTPEQVPVLTPRQ